MKKFIASMFVAGLALLAANTTFAQDPSQKMSEAELAKLEADLFVTLDSTDADSEAKALDAALVDDDGTAKCLWWRYRPAYYYYPSYYYYGWYCPVYYVPLRFVTYTVPVRYTVYTYTPGLPVAQTVVGAPAAADVAVVDDGYAVKSSGRTARGAVISKEIPAKSPLAKIGLRTGDIVTKIDGKPVTSMADLKKINKNSKVEFVKGKGIKIASKSMNVRGAKGGDSAGAASVQDIKAEKEVSLYDYFDNLEDDNDDVY